MLHTYALVLLHTRYYFLNTKLQGGSEANRLVIMMPLSCLHCITMQCITVVIMYNVIEFCEIAIMLRLSKIMFSRSNSLIQLSFLVTL